MNISADDIQKLIVSSGAIVDFDKLAPNSSLHESGLDSMDMMTLFLEVQEAYGLQITDQVAAELNSINDIVMYLNTNLLVSDSQ